MIASTNAYWRFKSAIATARLGTKVVPCPPAQCTGMEYTNSKGNIVSLCNAHDRGWQVCISDNITPIYTGPYAKAARVWARHNK